MKSKKGRLFSTLILTLLFSISVVSANSANLTAAYGHGYGYHKTKETGTTGTPTGNKNYRPVLEIYINFSHPVRVTTFYGNGTNSAKIFETIASNNAYHSHRLNTLLNVEPYSVSVDH